MEVWSDPQAKGAGPGEQGHEVYAVPGVGRVFLEGPAVCGDRLFQCLAGARIRLVTGIIEYLFMGTAEQADRFGKLRVCLGQPPREGPQEIDCHGRLPGIDQILSVQAAVGRVFRIPAADRLGESTHQVVLTHIAQACDEFLGNSEFLVPAQTAEVSQGIFGMLVQFVDCHAGT